MKFTNVPTFFPDANDLCYPLHFCLIISSQQQNVKENWQVQTPIKRLFCNLMTFQIDDLIFRR